MDLQVGDVLYAMNGKPLASLEAQRAYLDHLSKNAAVAIQLEGMGGYNTLPLATQIETTHMLDARRMTHP